MDIFEAVSSRNTDAVRAVLDSDPKAIKQTNSSGMTPLHMAAYHCRSVAMIQLLLDKGADPNERTPEGSSMQTVPLTRALGGLDEAVGDEIAIQEEIIAILLSRGATVRAYPGMVAPIRTAIYDNRPRVVKLMLPKWDDINCEEEDGSTLLHIAAYKGHKEIVELLLAHGACADLPDTEGLTAADMAWGRGHIEVAKILDGPDYNPEAYLKDSNLLASSFDHALRDGDVKTIGRCLRIHPPLAEAKPHGTPVLCLVAKNGYLDAVQLLVLHGASLDARNNAGRKAIEVAEEAGHRDVCDFLMQAERMRDESTRRQFVRAKLIETWQRQRNSCHAKSQEVNTSSSVLGQKGHTQLLLASSYLDDVQKSIEGFPESFLSTEPMDGALIGKKERLIKSILEGPVADAFTAMDEAKEHGIDQDQLVPVAARGHFLRAKLWVTLSCSPIAKSILSHRERFPDSTSPSSHLEERELKQREDALCHAAADFQKANDLSGDKMALWYLAAVLFEQGRFDESHALYGRFTDIETAIDGEHAIAALKAQKMIEGEKQKQLEREQARIAQQQTRSAQQSPSKSSTGGGSCYIATACYGSYDHPDVRIFRQFRDQTLMPSMFGRIFVWSYYRLSPPIATRLGHVKWLASVIRKWFLEPLARKLR